MGAANDGLRLLLELGALAALCYWGFTTHTGARRWLLGLGAPLAAAVAWGLLVAPGAAAHLDDPWRLLAELAVFGAAVGALVGAGGPGLARLFALAVAINLVLTFVLGQR
jgi:uncharacterized protein DUF2568